MADHHRTAVQSRRFFGKYCTPSSYRVSKSLRDVNGLFSVESHYDLILLDRDCTIQRYHGRRREPEFEEVLKALGYKMEIVSNSSLDEFRHIGDLYSDLMPVSKLVQLREYTIPHLLTIDKGEFQVSFWHGMRNNNTEIPRVELSEAYVRKNLVVDYKKPDPRVVRAVVYKNMRVNGSSVLPLTLMVGDRYLTDIVCGNLAGVDTALVLPYRPSTDKPDLIATRYIVDLPVGTVMRTISGILDFAGMVGHGA